MYIFTKFHKDWTIIVDFLLIAKFLTIPDNYDSPSMYPATFVLPFFIVKLQGSHLLFLAPQVNLSLR